MATILAQADGDWDSDTPDSPWPSGTVPGINDDVDLNGKNITIPTGVQATCKSLINTVNGNLKKLIFSANSTLNCNLIIDAILLVENALGVTINTGTSPNFPTISGGLHYTTSYCVYPSSAYGQSSLTINGDLIVTGSGTAILTNNTNSLCTVCVNGNAYASGGIIYSGTNSISNGEDPSCFLTITGDIFISGDAVAIYNASNFMVTFNGDLHTSSSVTAMTLIDEWSGAIPVVPHMTWYGNCYNTGTAAAAISIGANCFIDNWYGNFYNDISVGDTSGMLLAGTISNWHGDLHGDVVSILVVSISDIVTITATGQILNWVGNLYIAECSFYPFAILGVNLAGEIKSWIGDMHLLGSAGLYGTNGVGNFNSAAGTIDSWIGNMYCDGYNTTGLEGAHVKSWIGDAFIDPTSLITQGIGAGVNLVDSWTYFTDNNGQAEDAVFLSIQQGTTALHDLIHSRLPVIPPHIVASEDIMYEEPRYQHAPTSMDGTLLSLDPLAANVLDTTGNYYINSVAKTPTLDSTKVLDPIGTLPKASVLKSSGGTLNANYSY